MLCLAYEYKALQGRMFWGLGGARFSGSTMTSGNSNERGDTKPRLFFLLVSNDCFLFLWGVFFPSFQLDTGSHPRLFRQVPIYSISKYQLLLILTILWNHPFSPSLVGPISSPWIIALFPPPSSIPLSLPCHSPIFNSTLYEAITMTWDTSDCHILCLKCAFVPAHCVQYVSHATARHSETVTQHTSELPPLDVSHLRLQC